MSPFLLARLRATERSSRLLYWHVRQSFRCLNDRSRWPQDYKRPAEIVNWPRFPELP